MAKGKGKGILKKSTIAGKINWTPPSVKRVPKIKEQSKLPKLVTKGKFVPVKPIEKPKKKVLPPKRTTNPSGPSSRGSSSRGSKGSKAK